MRVKKSNKNDEVDKRPVFHNVSFLKIDDLTDYRNGILLNIFLPG